MGNFLGRAVSRNARLNGLPEAGGEFVYRLGELCVSLLLFEDLFRIRSKVS